MPKKVLCASEKEQYILDNIRRYIAKSGFKQRFIAEKAGVPATIFYAISKGQQKIPVYLIPVLAEILNVTPNDFFKK